MVALLSHLRTGAWASVLPVQWTETLALAPGVEALPLEEPEVANTVGLVVPHREPLPVLSAALVAGAGAGAGSRLIGNSDRAMAGSCMALIPAAGRI